jgi:lysophospholipase L1-like esterase
MPDAPEPAPAPRRPRLSRARRLAFAGVILGLALLACEAVARVAFEPPRPTYLDHPYLRRVRAPGSSHTLRDPWTDEEFLLQVDAHGFRTTTLEPPGTPKPAGTYRIFFLGASTTENVVLPDERTWPALVARALEARLGGAPKVHAVNAALSGNTIADSFSMLAHRVLALEPDLVVMLEGINDLVLGMSERFDPTHERDARAPPRPRLSDWLVDRSRLLQVAGRALERLGDEDRGERLRARREGQAPTPGLDPTRGLPSFRRYLRMSAALCRQAQVPLLLLSQPSIYKERLSPDEVARLWMGNLDHGQVNADPETMRRGMLAFNACVRDVAREEGALFLDLDAALPKDLERFYDDCHYTAKGNEEVARAVVEALLAGGRLP